ncbi:MAG: phosphoglycerate mutase [Planctomycetaceae bacterium]|nr:phosphoglycerate mutase [Planctomycetaceae bacterium]MCH2594643.1 histidine phosphatase family protein [Pirellulales bacterium]HCK42074.1 histidine phosphatase family protein [Planctomycetaceae bacterium]
MLKVLLIRTGATEYDSQGRVQGTLDVPLSEDGRQQVEMVAEELSDHSIDALYAGPCRATKQSADLLAQQLQLKAKTVDDLSNLNHGLWQGMLIEDVKSKQPKVYRQWQEHPENVCPPEGESLQVVRERLQQALTKIAKKQKSGVIAIVVPEPVTSVMRNVLRDDDLGDLWHADCNQLPSWELIEMPAKVGNP